MSYHVIIAIDKRKEGREAIKHEKVLHSIGNEINILNAPNILYVAEWDGVSTEYKLLKGTADMANMAFAGWPMPPTINNDLPVAPTKPSGGTPEQLPTKLPEPKRK